MIRATQYLVVPLAPVGRALSYAPSAREALPLVVGSRVVVPLGGRRVVGVVSGIQVDAEVPEGRRLREISEVLDSDPVVDAEVLELVAWIADYYFAPLGEVLRLALPASLQRREERRVRIAERGREVLVAQAAVLRREDEWLTEAERQALETVVRSRSGVRRQRAVAMGHGLATLRALVERGLVTEEVDHRTAAAHRTDLLVELLPEATTVGGEHRNAPRQEALLQRLGEVGGPVLLSELEDLPEGARGLARALARKGKVRVEEVPTARDPFADAPRVEDVQHELTVDQTAALASLLEAAEARTFRAFLLHGVTGSGKTEVYLRLIDVALRAGRSALVLVPEISLTPQLAGRFRARFGGEVAVLHSGLSDAQRYEQWRLLRTGSCRIAVGARSAVFAPLADLGVVIVDEEHDGSFKQEEGVRYHARDVALVRAKRSGAVAVLGSATPSLESYHGAMEGRLALLKLPGRVREQVMPEVVVLDLRRYQAGEGGILSAPLAAALAETLEQREQAILFLNRRGYANFVLCKGCGYVFRCGECSVSLTHHERRGRLVCHYCGFSRPRPTRCPECDGDTVELLGLGTERVEEALRARFPSARVARLDRDSARGAGLNRILRQVHDREVDILVGTQMVAKGHDFPSVTLVGVVCADQGLHFPDFRAAERTFQLLTQVAGRAGRGDRPGRVVVQTYQPMHPSIEAARTHDYDGFFAQELRARRELQYPPLGHVIALRFEGPDGAAVGEAAKRVASHFVLPKDGTAWVMGPVEAPIARIKGRSRWLLLVRGRTRQAVRDATRRVWQGDALREAPGVRVVIDVDPQSLL
ncbi:MAG: primosomal protein N' [Deltaproteobacteria bacterium]|nr:primosomal protein N' [Deltaproteobacteria bacterium]